MKGVPVLSCCPEKSKSNLRGKGQYHKNLRVVRGEESVGPGGCTLASWGGLLSKVKKGEKVAGNN